ncbi:hypothetical protein K2173_008813 [Erythroxylum novogranatense]|uniref:F-box domain-containing protein n=1 Tax=Erythroxylum novogranatense TaxID=1862640 RepID=A0AAV8SL75_9ROSI|nr:hypothetical protein K2173_008813 [Erythroxylum novogranatense]
MGRRRLDLSALPEDCIENVLSFSGPRDTCRLSVISSLFKSAAESDAVWEKNLPPDYRSIISRSTDPSMLTRFSSLKDLYFSLCDNPILIDGAMLSFSLKKSTGKKCYMLSARNLEIIWGDTSEYWQWTSGPECRFGEVAELIKVCWLSIRGKISASLLSPATFYSAYLVFQLTTRTYGFDDHPLDVYWDGGESPTRSVYLNGPYRRERKDGWFEIELGEFYNNEGEEGEIVMSVFETDDFNWKCGLIVQGIEIRPREIDSATKPKEIDSAEKPLSLRRSKRVKRGAVVLG